MHIKSVTLSNFRSFKQQPEIHPFSPEMNCVVGRNGSGKSNLFDAVQFVLGCPKFWSLRTVSCLFVVIYFCAIIICMFGAFCVVQSVRCSLMLRTAGACVGRASLLLWGGGARVMINIHHDNGEGIILLPASLLFKEAIEYLAYCSQYFLLPTTYHANITHLKYHFPPIPLSLSPHPHKYNYFCRKNAKHSSTKDLVQPQSMPLLKLSLTTPIIASPWKIPMRLFYDVPSDIRRMNSSYNGSVPPRMKL